MKLLSEEMKERLIFEVTQPLLRSKWGKNKEKTFLQVRTASASRPPKVWQRFVANIIWFFCFVELRVCKIGEASNLCTRQYS